MFNRKVKIAILDSGIDESLKDEVYYCESYIEDDVIDRFGHGTMCYNLIKSYVSNAEFYIYKILNDTGMTSSLILRKSLENLLYTDVDVINLSISIISEKAYEEIKIMEDVCKKLREQCKIIVCSLKNGCLESSFPAVYKSVIGVRGTSFKNNNTYWFNKYDKVQAVASSSPMIIPSINGVYDLFKGNSKAAAIMSGIIGKMLENKQINKSPEKLEEYLYINATNNEWKLKDLYNVNYCYTKKRLIDKANVDKRLADKVEHFLKDRLSKGKNGFDNFWGEYLVIDYSTFNYVDLVIKALPELEKILDIKINWEKMSFYDIININLLCKKIQSECISII